MRIEELTLSFRFKPPLGTPLNLQHSLAHGLVGSWLMNERSGTRVTDSSPNKNHLTNFTPSVNVKFTQSGLYMSGASVDIYKTGSKNLPSSKGSAALRLYSNQWDYQRGFFELSDGVGSNRILLYTASGWFYLYIYGGGSGVNCWTKSNPGYVDGVTYSIVVTWDTVSDTYQVYTNGILVVPTATPVANTPSSISKLNIGSFYDGSDDYWGGMEYFHLYDRILTAREMLLLHHRPYAMYESSLDLALFGYGLVGTVTWGHDTGVVEANIRDYSGNWTGTGAITGAGDAEQVELQTGEYMESEDWHLGSCLFNSARLRQNVYAVGDDVTLKYKTAATKAALPGTGWSAYVAPFKSLGWVKVRIER